MKVEVAHGATYFMYSARCGFPVQYLSTYTRIHFNLKLYFIVLLALCQWLLLLYTILITFLFQYCIVAVVQVLQYTRISLLVSVWDTNTDTWKMIFQSAHTTHIENPGCNILYGNNRNNIFLYIPTVLIRSLSLACIFVVVQLRVYAFNIFFSSFFSCIRVLYCIVSKQSRIFLFVHIVVHSLTRIHKSDCSRF